MTPWRALSVVVLPPALGLAAALVLWQMADRAGADAAAKQTRLVEALARPTPSLQSRAAALLVPGKTAGLAASALQSLVMARIADSGVQITEVAPGAAEPAAPLTRLHLTLHLAGDETQVTQALAALETAVPLIALDRVDLQGSGQDGGVLTAVIALSAYAGQVQP